MHKGWGSRGQFARATPEMLPNRTAVRLGIDGDPLDQKDLLFCQGAVVDATAAAADVAQTNGSFEHGAEVALELDATSSIADDVVHTLGHRIVIFGMHGQIRSLADRRFDGVVKGIGNPVDERAHVLFDALERAGQVLLHSGNEAFRVIPDVAGGFTVHLYFLLREQGWFRMNCVHLRVICIQSHYS